MKIAVLCSGYLRTFKTTIAQLKACILDQFDCDLYIYAHNNEYESDHYINKKSTHDEFVASLKPKMYVFEHAKQNESVLERQKQMWFKIYTLNEIRKQVEARDYIKYDRIIRIRPDVLLQCKPEEMKNVVKNCHDCIAIPTTHSRSYPDLDLDSFPGYNDQFAVGPPSLMNVYCDVYSQILSNTYEAVNSTSLLRAHLSSNQVNVQLVDLPYKLLLKENVIITIAGDSAAGKSTFCQLLKEKLTKQTSSVDILIFECDRYHKWERGHEQWKHYTHLHPEANLLEKMKDDILCLKANEQILQVNYDHHSGTFTTKQPIHPSNIVLVSGLHTLYQDQMNFISDLKIYLDTDEKTRVEWKVERDQVERGHSREKIMQSIQARKQDCNLFIEPQKQQADLVLQPTIDQTNKDNKHVLYKIQFCKQPLASNLLNIEELSLFICKHFGL